jgi:hypothetical protein
VAGEDENPESEQIVRVFKFRRIAETTVLVNDRVKPISCRLNL